MDHKTRIEHFLQLGELEDQMIDLLSRIQNTHHIDKRKITQAKARVRSAIQMVKGEVDVTRKVPDTQMVRITSQIQDMARRGRTKFYLEVLEDGSGITNIISGEEYPFEKVG